MRTHWGQWQTCSGLGVFGTWCGLNDQLVSSAFFFFFDKGSFDHEGRHQRGGARPCSILTRRGYSPPSVDLSIIVIIIYPLTDRWGTTNDFTTSFLHFSPLPSWPWRTPSLSIPWCCLPTSSSVCLVFLLLSLCLARWFWPDPMNGWHVHITVVCVSLRWSGGLRVVRLPAGSWHGLPR